MAISKKFSLVCDDFRQENNGKFIIIGVYTPNMTVAQIPFVCPTLTFVFWLESDRLGPFQFRAKLSHLESGAVITEMMGGVNFVQQSVGMAALPFRSVPLSLPGTYTLALYFEGQPEPITMDFGVILMPPPMLAGRPLGFPQR
jgi:hypothetical protein